MAPENKHVILFMRCSNNDNSNGTQINKTFSRLLFFSHDHHLYYYIYYFINIIVMAFVWNDNTRKVMVLMFSKHNTCTVSFDHTYIHMSSCSLLRFIIRPPVLLSPTFSTTCSCSTEANMKFPTVTTVV